MALLIFNDKGIYCPQADVYIDPWRGVDKALITHAHADHARFGSKAYLSHRLSVPIMKHRLGADINIQAVEYGEPLTINGVEFSFHPAGHIPGSAQIRAAYRGEVWVVSGDYKLSDDGLSTPFEPVACQHFITESTFGLPVYRWPDQQQVFDEINLWWRENQAAGKVSLVGAYSLGKAQRILKGLDQDLGSVWAHGAVYQSNEILRTAGLDLPACRLIDKDRSKKDFAGGLVLCPPSALGSNWVKKFAPYQTAFCSGWMSLRGTRRRRAADRGFVLSDHADWEELNRAVEESQAENIYVTHGYQELFARWLREEKGLNAQAVETLYEGDEVSSEAED